MTVSLNGKVIGTAAFSPKLQTTHRRKLLQAGLLTSLFNIPLTIPLGTPAGLQVSYKSLKHPAYRRCTVPARFLSCSSWIHLSLARPGGVLVISPPYAQGRRQPYLCWPSVTITHCLITDSALQQLILAFTGNGNFNPSATGLNGSPQGLLINIVSLCLTPQA